MNKCSVPEVVADGRRYRVITDPEYGYRRLDPIPQDDELARFYQSDYYHLIRAGGGRAHELNRLMKGGEEARRELQWLRSTLYADLAYVIRAKAPGRRVLDVGCGRGDALAFLAEDGFDAFGIEPSEDAAAAACAQGLSVQGLTLEEFVNRHSAGHKRPFDAVTLLCVLEHVPDPVATLKAAMQLLAPGGLLAIQVPNDFNELQLTAYDILGKPPWWIAVPDHINYFDFASLHGLLDRVGFDVVHSQGDFPMELFLLMGDDYVGNDEVGSACHGKRVRFEGAISPDLRRRLYQAMSALGVSRDCLVFGKLRAR